MAGDYSCVICKRPFYWEQLQQTPEGNLFCSPCWDKFKNEPKRNCPVDETEMQKLIVAEIIKVDRCPNCGGSWFDSGEFEILKEHTLRRSMDPRSELRMLF
jgi:hypothetical protein